MEASNYYEDKANRQFLHQTKNNTNRKADHAEAKPEKWKETATGVGTDLVIGVLGGGLVAATIGKPALLVGLVVSGYGHYAQNRMISALGLGIMASGTMSALNSKAQAPDISDRLKAFKEELKRKLYLDKLFPATKTENLNGTKSIVSKQPGPAQTPKPSDFILKKIVEEETKQEELNPHVDGQNNTSANDDVMERDFNERLY